LLVAATVRRLRGHGGEMEADRRNVAALAAFNAFRGLAIGGYMALFPMYMRSLGYPMETIGGVIAGASVLMALALPALGAVIDYYGPRRMVAATGLLAAAASVAAAASHSLPGLAASYTLFLLSFMAGQPARMAFLAASVGPERMGRYVGLTSSVFSGSHAAGPLAAGVAAEELGYPAAFNATAALLAAGTLLFLAVSRGGGGGGGGPLRARIVASYRRSLKPERRFAGLLAFIALDRAAWTLWFPLLSAHLYSLGYGEAETGGLMTVMGVVRTAAMPVAGLLVDRLGSWAAIAGSEALGSLVAAGLAAGPGEPWIYAWMALLGFSISLWVPAYNAAIARIAGGSGEAYATANMVRSLAGAPAPYLGGLLYDALAPWAPFAASSALLAAAALAAATLIRRAEAGWGR